MATCSTCNIECCPSAPDITIEQNIVELNGSTFLHCDEYFSVDDATITGGGLIITLANYPYMEASVRVYKNGNRQNRGATEDYEVNGQTVTLHAPAVSGDKYLVEYDSVEGIDSTTLPTGSRMGYEGSGTIAGFLRCDGTTAHSQTTYADLWTYLQSHTDLMVAGSYSGTTFTLANMNMTYTSGSELKSMGVIIKT